MSIKQRFASLFKGYYWVMLVIIALDQVTKWIVVSLKPNMQPIINGFFYFDYQRNTGAAWSILSGNTIILAFFSLIIGVAFIFYRIKKDKVLTNLMKLDIAFIVGGTLGNFIDRAFYEEGVIDFLSLVFGNYYFPVFNIADMTLVIGFIGLALLVALNKEKIPSSIDEGNKHE